MGPGSAASLDIMRAKEIEEEVDDLIDEEKNE